MSFNPDGPVLAVAIIIDIFLNLKTGASRAEKVVETESEFPDI